MYIYTFLPQLLGKKKRCFYSIKCLDFDVSCLFHFSYILLFGTTHPESSALCFYKTEKLLHYEYVGKKGKEKHCFFYIPVFWPRCINAEIHPKPSTLPETGSLSDFFFFFCSYQPHE